MDTSVVILAAGEGTRMKSALHKVLHPLVGRPMIQWVMEATRGISDKPIIVVGHKKESVMDAARGALFAIQEPLLGTGHAMMAAMPKLADKKGYVLAAAGDMPLIQAETYEKMVELAKAKNASCVVMTTLLENPAGYGRIVRDGEGRIVRIVEDRDANEVQKQICEINSAVYCFHIQSLLEKLPKLTNDNAQNQYYLTDVIQMMAEGGERVEALVVDSDECQGINDRVQLAAAEAVLRRRINERLMREGVTMMNPENIYIGPEVVVGRDTVIYPGNHLEGKTRIGANCILYPGSRILDSEVGDGCTVQSAVMEGASVDENTTVGPFAYLRPNSFVGKGCRIGDFVELKNARIGDGTKVSHLTYIGDGVVGERVNVGCGVVFSNYDGKKKYVSTVGDDVFIGCNVNLVAPVQVGDGAYIAAGSTVTTDAPGGALYIARSRPTVKEGWVDKHKQKDQKEEV